MKLGTVVLTLLLLTLSSTPVQAQDVDPPPLTEGTLAMSIDLPRGPELQVNNYDEQGTFDFTVRDLSRDGADGTGQEHQITVSVTPVNDDTGWRVFVPVKQGTMFSGDTKPLQVRVTPTTDVGEFDLTLKVNVTMSTLYCCGSISSEFEFQVRSPGTLNSFAQAKSNLNPEAAPDDILDFDVAVTNKGLVDRTYRLVPVENKCNLYVSDAIARIPSQETRIMTVQIVAPSDKFYYLQENCGLSLAAEDTDSGRQSNTVPIQVKVQGAYVDPGPIFNILIAAAILAVIIWFILAAKRRTEEEILGKPQPPWTLPAEQLYLAELEKKDPQAAYVVRHFLMEDEYASSLMWYSAYKKATRGRRAMERKVLRMEHSFEKWDLKQQDKLANMGGRGDRKVEKLQAKLDRKARKAHKKDHKKWRKVASKLEAKAANDHNKALGEWKKDAKKAKKQGNPEPQKPVMAKVDLPAEPELELIPLEDHKWAAKKDKLIEADIQAEEKAEAKYEQEREKRLAKMHQAMAKWADKIDDPAFVAEHPLLQEASRA